MKEPLLQLNAALLVEMKEQLPETSAAVVAAIVEEVPSYSRAFAGPMGATITEAVALALESFLDMVSRHRSGSQITPEAMRKASYDLGRGEARSGRTTDALLAAYRVGMRVSWQRLSMMAVDAGLTPAQMARFADGVFAYIDELSAQSVAGHDDELETTGRVRERLRERLAQLLLSNAPADAVHAAARRAEWEEPTDVTVLLVAPSEVRSALTALGRVGTRSLVAREDVRGLPERVVAILIPDGDRAVARRALASVPAVLGPRRPYLQAAESFALAARAHGLDLGPGLVDVVDHLTTLLLGADASLRNDLRAQALAPLDSVRPQTREKLEDTLRAWLLCQGRRDDVAELLFVHPQTVRYRMGQIRELFGDRLEKPDAVLELVLALG